MPGATEANRKKIISCKGNLKGRREVCVFNYDNTSLSGKLNSTRKFLIINSVIPATCLLTAACLIDSGWQREPADKDLSILPHGTSENLWTWSVCVCGVWCVCRMYICFYFCFSRSVLENSSFLFSKISWQCPVCSIAPFPPSTFCLLLSPEGFSHLHALLRGRWAGGWGEGMLSKTILEPCSLSSMPLYPPSSNFRTEASKPVAEVER